MASKLRTLILAKLLEHEHLDTSALTDLCEPLNGRQLSNAMQNLKAAGHVEIKDREWWLTDSGREVAEDFAPSDAGEKPDVKPQPTSQPEPGQIAVIAKKHDLDPSAAIGAASIRAALEKSIASYQGLLDRYLVAVGDEAIIRPLLDARDATASALRALSA